MQSIGFEKSKVSTQENREVLKNLKTEDLIQFGFESEFVGRLPVYIVLNELDVNGLYKILKNRYSTVVLGKKLDFRAYGIDLDFTDDALMELAKRAYNEKTGARGLLSVFEKVLIKFEKKLPSTGVKKLTVDMELINSPDTVLEKLVVDDGIKKFQKEFLIDHGIYLNFDDNAFLKIAEKSKSDNKKVRDLCDELFRDYFHGIRLMKLESFTVPGDAVDNPKGFLDEYIKQNYVKD